MSKYVDDADDSYYKILFSLHQKNSKSNHFNERWNNRWAFRKNFIGKRYMKQSEQKV